jgi:hypothetical protein
MRVSIGRRIWVPFLVLGIALVAWSGFIVWVKFYAPSQFGRVEISLGNGSKIYAMRESRGLSDELVWLTQNADGCITADPAKDYVIESPADPSVLYAVTADGLTIFDYPINRMVKEPTHPWMNIRVMLSRSKEPFYDDVRADPSKYGAVRTKIPLNELCMWNSVRNAMRQP